MSDYQVHSIGTIDADDEDFFIQLDEEYIPALQGLEGFSHLVVLWWFSDFDNEEARSILEVPKPYVTAPEIMGIFATRSPVRPNPLGLTAIEVASYDLKKGTIRTHYIDAHPGTPVLDLKPYTPSSDRVEDPQVPAWCDHWPKSFEESGSFNWEEEFTF